MTEHTPVHPASYRLEELAAGVGDAETRAHVAECAACRAYVDDMTRAAERYAKTDAADAAAFMDRVHARAEGRADERAAPLPAQAGAVRRMALTRVAWVVAPLAAAAVAVLVMRPPPRNAGDDARPTGPDRVLMAPMPERLQERMKGATPGLAVIVERADGAQERVTGEVRVRTGDRARLEVSVDRASPIVAGILEDNGAWTALLAPAELDAGTHFSEQAARFDATSRGGWVLAGPPDAVERARATRDFHAVAVLPIVRAP